MSGQSGQTLNVAFKLLNPQKTDALIVGPSSLTYELLNTAGEVMFFPERNGQLSKAETALCEMNKQCPLASFPLPLYRMNPALSLPAGEYKLRVKLRDLNWGQKKLEFGGFDIPVTFTP